MIQRIQSFWLFLAAAFNASPLILSFYEIPVNGTAAGGIIKVTNHFPSLLLTVVCTLLPLVTIFFYGNRKRQTSMSVICGLATSSLLTTLLSRTNTLITATPGANGNYGISGILLALSIVVIVLAILGIRKDEKLVKSVDRLR